LANSREYEAFMINNLDRRIGEWCDIFLAVLISHHPAFAVEWIVSASLRTKATTSAFTSTSPIPLAKLAQLGLKKQSLFELQSFSYKAELFRPIQSTFEVGDTKPSPSGSTTNPDGLQCIRNSLHDSFKFPAGRRLSVPHVLFLSLWPF
jgi:hypothetical protein